MTQAILCSPRLCPPRLRQILRATSGLVVALHLSFSIPAPAWAEVDNAQATTEALKINSGDGEKIEIEARAIIEAAMQHWRGLSSKADMTMIIHRPDWERRMRMRTWTKGDSLSLVRVTEPKKDAGNGTLLNDTKMWSFAPRINRIIKIPSSMMNQGWMGSDFSNKDISKSTEILDQYTHELSAVKEDHGHRIYTITSTPHEDAAVVWGKEVLDIRDDFVMLKHSFWDQDNVLVKVLRARDIKLMDGRAVASKSRMQDVSKKDEWTEMQINSIEFDVDLDENVFTLSNLRNPRSH